MLDEIEAHRQQPKKKKRFNTIIGIVDTSLITSSAITGETSIAGFASGAGVPVGAALGGLGVVLSLSTIGTRKYSRSLTVKQGKHDAIKLLAQSKLDSIADIISRAIQDGTSHTLNLTKYCRRWKNIINLRLTLGIKPRPVLLSIIVSSFLATFF